MSSLRNNFGWFFFNYRIHISIFFSTDFFFLFFILIFVIVSIERIIRNVV